MSEKQYAERDAMALEKAGGWYSLHVSAMTTEGLHSKSDIAAELAWRDVQIMELKGELLDLKIGFRKCEFCGCRSNAKSRACCEKGREADKLSAAPAAQPMTQTQVERLVSASPIYQAAINALNGVKAWRDDDCNDGFPHELRLAIEGILMAYELRNHRIKEQP